MHFIRKPVPFAGALILSCLLAPPAGAQPVHEIEFSSHTVPEGAGSFELCVLRSGDLSNRSDVFISTRDGTATSDFPGDIDFQPLLDGPVIFFTGQDRVCFPLLIFDDPTEEDDEFFTVFLHDPTVGVLGPNATATVVILDDETAAPDEFHFAVTDHDHAWSEDPLIPYEITIGNDGETLYGVAVTEVVPVQTVFDAASSTPGWSCDPGPDEGSLCTLALGELAAGDFHTLVFAVRVREDTPDGFEVLNTAGFVTAGQPPAAVGAVRSHRGNGSACSEFNATFNTNDQNNDNLCVEDRAFESWLDTNDDNGNSVVECTINDFTASGLVCCAEILVSIGRCLRWCDMRCTACPPQEEGS